MALRWLVCLPLFLAACGAGHRSVSTLDNRMQTRLADEVAAGDASVQRLPDGVRVVLLHPTMMPNGDRDARADLIEAMLDPSLMRVSVEGNDPAQVQGLEQFFRNYELGGTLVPAAASGSEALAVTVHVVCPRHVPAPGDDSGHPTPHCD
jgi:hypothetical protein